MFDVITGPIRSSCLRHIGTLSAVKSGCDWMNFAVSKDFVFAVNAYLLYSSKPIVEADFSLKRHTVGSGSVAPYLTK